MSALIWCPFPDADHANSVARTLIEEKLIACANFLGTMESLYRWGGKICSDSEFGVLFKTDAGMLDACIARLGELHEYDNPAILGWRCEAVHPATQVWLKSMGA